MPLWTLRVAPWCAPGCVSQEGYHAHLILPLEGWVRKGFEWYLPVTLDNSRSSQSRTEAPGTQRQELGSPKGNGNERWPQWLATLSQSLLTNLSSWLTDWTIDLCVLAFDRVQSIIRESQHWEIWGQIPPLFPMSCVILDLSFAFWAQWSFLDIFPRQVCFRNEYNLGHNNITDFNSVGVKGIMWETNTDFNFVIQTTNKYFSELC